MSSEDFVNLTGNIDAKRTPTADLKDRQLSLYLSSQATYEWLSKRRQNIRPWGTFVNTNRFKLPTNAGHVTQRVVQNVDYFQSNYIFVFIGLVLYCLLTSPLLLIAVAVSGGACYLIKLKNAQQKLKILGNELTLAQQYGLVMLCSFPLFYLAGAGSAVFWIIGASFFLIMVHAVFFAIESVNTGEESFDLQMETV